MEVCGWLVTHEDGSTCIFNADIKDLTAVQNYTIQKHGTYEEVVKRSVADNAVKEARGEFERAQLLEQK